MPPLLGCFRSTAATSLAASLLLLVLPGSLQAQSEKLSPEYNFDGQLRLRGEADGRTVDEDPDFATLSRIRLGARVTLTDWIRAYAQIQDSRAWGSESSTLVDASADQLDVHQVYAELGKSDGLWARLGRQRMPLADERLVGAVEWTNTGRSFDGVRLAGKSGEYSWTAFWYNVAERDSTLAVGLNPQLNQGINDDGWLIGGFATRAFGGVTSELTALVDRDAVTEESYTVNLRLHGRSGSVLFEAAGAYQFGPDRSAWFASGVAGVAVGRGTVVAQLDYLSGDDDPTDGDTKAFNTLYATNHKFYGFMDYFLAIPAQLDQAGLVDAILRGSLATSSNTSLRLDLHRFVTAEKRDDQRALGTELDAVGRWRFAPPANLELGVAVFSAEELLTSLSPAFANGDDTTWWGYAQLTLSWP